MIIYGGIFEITKELNDMHIFDIAKNQWVCLFEEINSPKKIQPESASPDKVKSPSLKLRPQNTAAEKGFSLSLEKQTTAKKTRKSPLKRKPLPLASQDNVPQVKLESPTSITMKNSFLIKNADPSFDKCYASIKKRALDKTSIDKDDAT